MDAPERAPGCDVHLIGVSVHTAPLAVRERLALDARAAGAALARAAGELAGTGVVVLSTCNRTELLITGVTADQARQAWHRLVVTAGEAAAGGHGCQAPAEVVPYHHEGTDAVTHLMRVACGLESSVLGDSEIVGQLRRAADLAAGAGFLDARARRLLDHVNRVAKAARSSTEVSAGGAGVGSAAASVVAGRYPAGARVVLWGAGDAASVIARELAKRFPADLSVVNRTPEKAASLVARFGGRPVPVEDADGALLAADVVITATSAPAPVLTVAGVRRLRRLEPSWSPLVVDAGFPRNVEPGTGLEVVPLESLSEREQRIRARREAAVPAVESLVSVAVASWLAAEHSRAHAARHRHGYERPRSHRPVPSPAAAPRRTTD